MALERKDNIGDTTASIGTGTINLEAVAQTGARIFAGNVTSGATVRYHIENADQSEWEVGEGVFTDATPDTLTRVTVYASSNSGSLVDFSAGTKNVSLVLTAEDVKTTETPYKIVPSVANNDLTVALKHMDGTDATVARPIWKKIGDSFYAITAALSVTKADATNWCNAGSAELATKEIDYFVYLGYNATDGVVIGFSRFPGANSYDDFSATTTNEKYAAISTITNAAATDYYVNIGRFAATLSAGAGYTWTVPTFAAKNLIQRPIYETRWLDWVPTLVGFSANPTNTVYKYQIRNNNVFIKYREATAGTSNATNFTATIPFTAKTITNMSWYAVGLGTDNNIISTTYFSIVSAGASITLTYGATSANWTTSGNKRAIGFIDYEI